MIENIIAIWVLLSFFITIGFVFDGIEPKSLTIVGKIFLIIAVLPTVIWLGPIILFVAGIHWLGNKLFVKKNSR